MNWNQLEGWWHQLAGQVKSEWARHTYDDLKHLANQKKPLAGRIQQHHGSLKSHGEKQIDA